MKPGSWSRGPTELSCCSSAPPAATGGLAWSATLLTLGPLIGIVMVATLFPDAHGVELEDITGEVILDSAAPQPATAVLP